MKFLRKPFFIVILAVVIGAVSVLAGLSLWIQSGSGRNWLKSKIDATIAGTVTISDVDLSFFKPGLELEGISLKGPDGVPVAGFDRFSIALRWWPLLRREVHIEEIFLHAPWADLVQDKAGVLNLMKAVEVPASEKADDPPPPEEGGGLPVNIVCDAFRLTDGRLSFKTADDATKLQANGIAVQSAGDLKAQLAELAVNLSSIKFQSAAFEPPESSVALKARLNGDRVNLASLNITAGKTTADLNGSVTALTAKPAVDATLTIQSEIAEIAKAANISGEYSGLLKAGVDVKGAVANPKAKLNLAMDKGLLAGRQVDRLRLSLTLEDRLVTIGDSILEIAGGAIGLDATANLRDAFPKGFLEPPGDMNTLAYSLDLKTDIPDLAPLLGPSADISGKVASHAQLEGKGIDPSSMIARVTMNAKAEALLVPQTLSNPIDADLDLAARMDRGTALLDQLTAVTEGLNLSGTGRFGLQQKYLAADLEVNATDLKPVLTLAGLDSAGGTLDANLHARGSLDSPELALDLTAADVSAAGYTIGALTLDAGMDPEGLLTLSALTLKNKQSHIEGRGRLRLQPGNFQIDPDYDTDASFKLASVSAADFMPSPPVEGTLNGQIAINGPLKALQADLTLKATSLTRQELAIGDIDTHLVWNDGTLDIERMTLTSHDNDLTAKGRLNLLTPGTLQLLDDPTFTLDINSDHLDPKGFTDQAKGNFALQAKLDGSVSAPRGTIVLNGEKIEAGGQPIESLSLDSRLDQDRLWIDNCSTRIASAGAIDISGWVGLKDQNMDVQLDVGGIDLTDIVAIQDRLTSGMLSAKATAKGKIENPEVIGNLSLADFAVNGEALRDLNLDFSLKDMQATAKGDLGFDLDAQCDLRQGDFQADLIFDDTETAAYFKAAGLADLHGKLSGRINAAGNIQDAPNLKATVAIDGLHLLSDDIALVDADRLRMNLENGRLSIPDFELRILTTGNLSLEGEARLDGDLNIRIDGKLPIAAAGAFVPDLDDATGSVALNGQLSGKAQIPKIDASIDFEAIALTVPGLAQTLHDLNGHILISDNAVKIENLGGFLDTGSFNLDGTIAHEQFAPTDLNLAIKAKSLPVEIPETLSLLLNTDIAIEGHDGTAEASGKINILEGVYYKDVKISLLKMATERKREIEPETEAVSIPYFKTVNLDIDIGSRQALTVENNMADLDISPDLNLGGTLDNPVISGRAQVKEGTVTFQKKDFEVTKGVIDFVNPYKTEPEIDITSEAEIRSWTITLSVKGPPDDLQLEMSSDPSETNADILSLILLGRTGSELSKGEGGSSSSTAQIMAEMIASTFGEDIKKRTGVDILEVEETSDDDDEESTGVKVTVGKHLSERMTVKYAVESKDGVIVQRAISEYKLLENILVSGFQGNDSVYGSELVFRIEFR